MGINIINEGGRFTGPQTCLQHAFSRARNGLCLAGERVRLRNCRWGWMSSVMRLLSGSISSQRQEGKKLQMNLSNCLKCPHSPMQSLFLPQQAGHCNSYGFSSGLQAFLPCKAEEASAPPPWDQPRVRKKESTEKESTGKEGLIPTVLLPLWC